MNRNTVLFLLATLVAGACSDPELENRVKALEEKVNALDSRGVGVGAPGAAPSATSEQEQAASALLRDASIAMGNSDFETAKAKVAELQAKYADTRSAKAAARFAKELTVVGKAEAPLTVEKWFQGSAADVANAKAKVFVFWEVWCPHCKTEVPKLAETWEKYNKRGLEIVGLTQMSREVTDQQVADFIRDNKLPYPIAKEQGSSMSDAYGVQGIPAAAVVKDGKVVWRGHPAKLTDALLEGFLGS